MNYYIEYLNKDNNFKREKIYFDSYQLAKQWGHNNIANFNSEMVFSVN